MKILYLYHMMKLNGPDYHRSKKLTDRLAEKHRIDMKYLVLDDAIKGSEPFLQRTEAWQRVKAAKGL